MKRLLLVTLVYALSLAGCSPQAAGTPPAPPAPATVRPSRPPTVVVSPAVLPTSSPAVTSAPAATLSEWEQVQRQLGRYRNLLDAYSDGHTGLTLALERPEPDETWCNGLTAGINDFEYVKDTESADALLELKHSQGCP